MLNIHSLCYTTKKQRREYISNIHRTVPLKRPARGIYNMTLVLLEYQQGGFRIVDYINYNNDERF